MPPTPLSDPGTSTSMGTGETRLDHDAYHELNMHLQQHQHEHDHDHEHERVRELLESKPKRASTSTKNRPRSPSPYRAHPGQSSTEFLTSFWQHSIDIAENVDDDFKHQALPLARIKKVMKSDPEVKASRTQPWLSELFIQEITNRAHMVSLASRRRTLARSDVAEAIAKSDMFDFLVDVVPRDEPILPPSAFVSSSASKSVQDSVEVSEVPKALTSRTILDGFPSGLDVGTTEDAVDDHDDEAGPGEDELAEETPGTSESNARKRASRAIGRSRGRPKKRPATDTGPSRSEREAEHEQARLVAEEQARHAAAMGHLQGKAAEVSNSTATMAAQMLPPNPPSHHSSPNNGMYGLSVQTMQAPPHMMGLSMGMGMGMGMPMSMPMGLPTSAAGSHEEYQRWMLEQFLRSGAHNAHPFMAPGSVPWANPFAYDPSHTFFAHTARRE
ncbi:BQ2448_3541 [Microbotryum intermedium]|uniref:BQ2448_3541 protein n=1 Tax=Microbotryum intermedium TaxID=269621 RepID=A0A238FDD0_9BASI|nr:BQ2448_3541 [Microbotryum intermedium]